MGFVSLSFPIGLLATFLVLALLPLLPVAAATVSRRQSSVPGFLEGIPGLLVKDSDMLPPRANLTVAECGAWCASVSSCISFNFCDNADGATACGIQTWSMAYNPEASLQCTWYRRSLPRNDAPAPRGVPWVLEVPAPGTVALISGPIADAFQGNINDYLKLRDPVDMLYWFAWRAGNQSPPGQCFGWDGWIKGSACGNFLMGAGSALQWTNDTGLRANVNQVVAGIRSSQDPQTGWLWAWKESDSESGWRGGGCAPHPIRLLPPTPLLPPPPPFFFTTVFNNSDNMPDYCAGWVTRGLLDAASAGVPDALQLARDSISLFNNHSR